MASKQFLLDENTVVTIYKRRGNRNVRLTITSGGEVRVSIPTWAPYATGLKFAHQRQAWIQAQKRPTELLTDGQTVGKAHHLRFIPRDNLNKPTSRIAGGELIVYYPQQLDIQNSEVQAAAHKLCVRGLRRQSEQLLPQRLTQLAQQHSYDYKSVSIKALKSRWGSCDSHKNIVLNLYLMQLPWENIDYVLLHELVHTKVLRHGPDFWQEFEKTAPDAKKLRKAMAAYHPVLRGSIDTAVA